MKYFYSLDVLSTPLIDIINIYILPFFATYSVICSLFSLITFLKSKLNVTINKYMLVESVASLVYSLLNCFVLISRCGSYCPYGYEYSIKIYEIYFYLYFGKTIELVIILIDLYLSILRYKSFSVKMKIQNDDKLKMLSVLAIFVFGSLAICTLSVLLPRAIVQLGVLVHNQTIENVTMIIIDRPLFLMSKSELASNEIFNIISQITSILQGPVLFFALIIINIMITIRLKKFLLKKSENISNKQSTINNNRKDIKMTILLIVICINIIIGHLPNRIANFMLYKLDLNSYNLYIAISIGLVWLSNGNFFLINLLFNEEFSKVFQAIVCRRKINTNQNSA